jgi:hypothetical protein
MKPRKKRMKPTRPSWQTQAALDRARWRREARAAKAQANEVTRPTNGPSDSQDGAT